MAGRYSAAPQRRHSLLSRARLGTAGALAAGLRVVAGPTPAASHRRAAGVAAGAGLLLAAMGVLVNLPWLGLLGAASGATGAMWAAARADAAAARAPGRRAIGVPVASTAAGVPGAGQPATAVAAPVAAEVRAAPVVAEPAAAASASASHSQVLALWTAGNRVPTGELQRIWDLGEGPHTGELPAVTESAEADLATVAALPAGRPVFRTAAETDLEVYWALAGAEADELTRVLEPGIARGRHALPIDVPIPVAGDGTIDLALLAEADVAGLASAAERSGRHAAA